MCFHLRAIQQSLRAISSSVTSKIFGRTPAREVALSGAEGESLKRRGGRSLLPTD